jgi:hypothetical protein
MPFVKPRLPQNETYLCTAADLDPDETLYVTGAEPLDLSSETVHHLVRIEVDGSRCGRTDNLGGFSDADRLLERRLRRRERGPAPKPVELRRHAGREGPRLRAALPRRGHSGIDRATRTMPDVTPLEASFRCSTCGPETAPPWRFPPTPGSPSADPTPRSSSWCCR